MHQEVDFPYRESSMTMDSESIKEQSEFVQETKISHRLLSQSIYFLTYVERFACIEPISIETELWPT